jgi:hypothetical protein
MSLQPTVRVVCTLLLALAAAELCVLLRTPIPWMIGPLLATAVRVHPGCCPRRSWDAAAQRRPVVHWQPRWGLYFTPQVTALVGSLWWAIVLGVVWALALGWAFGLLASLVAHAQRRRCRA